MDPNALSFAGTRNRPAKPLYSTWILTSLLTTPHNLNRILPQQQTNGMKTKVLRYLEKKFSWRDPKSWATISSHLSINCPKYKILIYP